MASLEKKISRFIFPSVFSLGWTIFLMIAYSPIFGQTISSAEYFFDTDPGAGNGIALPIATPADPVTFSPVISTVGLVPGRHLLCIRTRTSSGLWSLNEPREFFIEVPISIAEYFFDTDPGPGNGIPLSTITPIDPTTFASGISTAGLAPGRHLFNLRTRNPSGRWSLNEPREFFIQVPVARAEYFFDTDPGVGNAIPLPINTPLDDYTFESTVPVTGLADGDHYLFVRARDESGSWSLFEPRLFTVDSSLPVQLTDFAATRKGESVEISWITASEIRNDYFLVERAISDGTGVPEDFITTDQVDGNGSSTVRHSYQSHDRPPVKTGTAYYRLRQVDLDGKSTLSNTVAVLLDPSGTVIKLFPNPASGTFTLEIEGRDENMASVSVIDVSGRQIESFERTGNRLNFGRDWSAGIYWVRVTLSDQVLVTKVVKIK